MGVSKMMAAQTPERSQYLVRDYNDVTLRYVLRYPGRIDREVLSRAVRAVVESVDVLHGSLHLQKGKLVWKIWEELEEDAFFRCEDIEGEMRQLPYSGALESIDFEDPVKLRCVLIRDRAESAVILLVSHLVADGGDSKYLLHKVMEAYNRILREGSAVGLVVKNGSRDPAQAYAWLSKKEQKKLWKNPMSGPKNEFPFDNNIPGERVLLRQVISREVMEAARIRGKQLGATANDLVLAACYQAFAATEGVDQTGGLCVAAMMDLRRHCPGGDSAGLTNLAGALYTVLPQGVQGDYIDTLKKIAAQTEKDKLDPQAGLTGVPLMQFLVGNLPMKMLLKAADMVYGSMALGCTNLGSVGREKLALGERMPVDALFGGPVKKKPGVQISVLSLDGQCSLVIAGEYADRDIPALDDFLQRIVGEITDFVE